MKKASLVVNNFLFNNEIFDIRSLYNYDNHMYFFYKLKEEFKKEGIDLSTQDINTIDESEIIFYNNMPKNLPKEKDIHKSYLLIWESELTRSDNWNLENHNYFEKIFTWNDKYVDNKKYFKINFSSKMPADLDFDLDKKKKLCTMIVANKFKSHSLELYTERVKAIRWFEQNHPEDFDLYGIGWDKYYFKGNLSRLNRFNVLRRILKPKNPSYKGPIESKKEIYKRYKFAICYENARDISGYITEKIFDCFFAGCVPIYWGAPNITDHIPANTFIDRRNFKSYEELYQYLKNMPDKEYIDYLGAIKNFIKSDKIYPFSAECFAETLSNEILKEN